MDLPRFFRSYKHKRFNYIPLYYDQQKEELQARIRHVENQDSEKSEKNFQASIIRGSFRHISGYRAKANRASSLRTLLIILILLAFVFVLFSL